MLEFEVQGEPQGKGRLRHRVVRSKANPMGYASGYTPAQTIKYEEAIQAEARRVYRGAPLTGPVFLYVIAFQKIPKSFGIAKRAAALRGELRPLKKPDWDNFGKVVSDALNKIAFQDDAQVADAFVQKFYSDNPRMRIRVTQSKGISHAGPTNPDYFATCDGHTAAGPGHGGGNLRSAAA